MLKDVDDAEVHTANQLVSNARLAVLFATNVAQKPKFATESAWRVMLPTVAGPEHLKANPPYKTPDEILKHFFEELRQR